MFPRLRSQISGIVLYIPRNEGRGIACPSVMLQLSELEMDD